MTPADKDKLTKAFNAAVATSPYADEVIQGLYTNENEPLTRRRLVEGTLKDDSFYAEVDKMLAGGKVTLDQFIDTFEQGMKTSIYGPDSAPKR